MLYSISVDSDKAQILSEINDQAGTLRIPWFLCGAIPEYFFAKRPWVPMLDEQHMISILGFLLSLLISIGFSKIPFVEMVTSSETGTKMNDSIIAMGFG